MYKLDLFKKTAMELFGTENFRVLGFKLCNCYDNNGRKLDDKFLIKYTLADVRTLQHFDVKIENAEPLFPENTDFISNVIMVKLSNACWKPYKIEYGKIHCSVTAEGIVTVDKK